MATCTCGNIQSRIVGFSQSAPSSSRVPCSTPTTTTFSRVRFPTTTSATIWNCVISRILATASADKSIKLWNLETLEPMSRLIGHEVEAEWSVERRRTCGTAASRTTVATWCHVGLGEGCEVGSSDNTCRLWDIKSGRIIRHYTGHEKVGKCGAAEEKIVDCVALYERLWSCLLLFLFHISLYSLPWLLPFTPILECNKHKNQRRKRGHRHYPPCPASPPSSPFSSTQLPSTSPSRAATRPTAQANQDTAATTHPSPPFPPCI